MKRIHARSRSLLVLATLFCGAAAHAQTALPGGINPYACGVIGGPGQFGPFDYRTVSAQNRHTVEDFHFTPKVEQAIDGATGGFGGDIDYTLRAMPNNPRALLAISRYSLKRRQEHIPGAHWTTECYYERAFRYTPDDPMPHMVYAIFLKDRKRLGEVRAQLDEAERLRGDPSNADLDYNLGILYTDIGAYDKAAVAAKRAYALGAPMPALMNRLKKVGKWQEPTPPAAEPAPAPASTSTSAPASTSTPTSSSTSTPTTSPRDAGDRTGEVH